MRSLFVHEWFSENVRKYPSAAAIRVGKTIVTFSELERQSREVSRILLERGARKGDMVVLLTDDRRLLITSILGTLMTGCIFVPISPTFPKQRLDTLLGLIEPRIIVADYGWAGRHEMAVAAGRTIQVLDAQTLSIGVESDRTGRESIDPKWNSDDCCYVFFTSGSNGNPKAIAGRLKAIDHFVRWEIEACAIQPGARASQLISPSFDAILRDIFVPLCSGGTICVAPRAGNHTSDAELLCKWIEEEEISLIHCVPTLLRFLLSGAQERTFRSVTHLLTSGEVLTPGDVSRWRERCGNGARLVNLYGPSETTMTKFAYFVSDSDHTRDSIPIGKPIRGASAILLDAQRRPSPHGAVGEIYIRTAFRSLGYHRQPRLTEEVFIPNPFRDDPGDLLYKTGDLGRVLEDGNYEFLGRIDGQVKVRGIRIEPSEIESALRTHPKIRECAVTTWETPSGEPALCAYVVVDGDTSSGELRDYLCARLPEYMVPWAYVVMESLPLTANGKLDRRGLPQPERERGSESSYVAPRTAVEEILCGIWAEVLRLERVGVEDNFFELGGDSILAIQIITRAREAGLKLVPQDLFRLRTIARLSESATASSSLSGSGSSDNSNLVPPSPERFALAKLTPEALSRVIDKLQKRPST